MSFVEKIFKTKLSKALLIGFLMTVSLVNVSAQPGGCGCPQGPDYVPDPSANCDCDIICLAETCIPAEDIPISKDIWILICSSFAYLTWVGTKHYKFALLYRSK